MAIQTRNAATALLLGISLHAFPDSLWASDVRTETDGTVHSKGVVILRLTFPSRGEVWRVQLNTSRDGEEFGQAGFGRLGIPDLYRTIIYGASNTTILVPAVGWLGNDIAFFEDLGPHWFRWEVTFRDQDKLRTAYDQRDYEIAPVIVEQVVDVERPTPVDVEFIAGLAEADLLRAIAGADFFERQTGNARGEVKDPELRASIVISRLLSATRESDPGSVKLPKGDVLRTADMLAALARDIPDSSYAPYAAYYAGCCYLTALAESFETMLKEKGFKYPARTKDELQSIATLVKEHAEYAQAKKALDLAIKHADAYLKPLAIYMKVCLPMLTSDWDEAEEQLARAVTEAGGTGTIHDMVDKARRDIRHAKGKSATRKQGAEPSSTP